MPCAALSLVPCERASNRVRRRALSEQTSALSDGASAHCRGARAPSRAANYGDPIMKSSGWAGPMGLLGKIYHPRAQAGVAERRRMRSMQRPVMNPNFALESPSAGKARKSRFEWLWRIFRFIGRLLTATPVRQAQAVPQRGGDAHQPSCSRAHVSPGVRADSAGRVFVGVDLRRDASRAATPGRRIRSRLAFITTR